MSFHPLARRHLLQSNHFSPGMPAENFDQPHIRRLHLNLNYFTNSPYIYYPNEENSLLFSKYVDFLNFERQSKSAKDPLTLESDQIMFIASSEAIDLILRAFGEPKHDSIAILEPAFSYYGFAASNNDLSVVKVPLTGRDYEEFSVEKILAHQPKITFVNVPNNPVGSIPKRSQILHLLQQAKGLVVIDEAYIEFSDESSYVDLIHDFPNLAILRSFSKVWGMAGIRCGAVIGQPPIINTLKRMRPPCSFPTHTQQLIAQTLNHPELVLEVKEKTREQRQFLTKQLLEIDEIHKVFASHTNFILVQLEKSQQVFEKLFSKGILIKNMHPLIPNALRISIGKKDDHKHLAQAIKEIFKELNHRETCSLK